MTTTWLELRKSLIEQGRLHNVFSGLSEASWQVTNSNLLYEPLLITKHVDRLSDLIERCLSLRKDIRDLEILAVKSGAEYDLFVKTSVIDEQMEKLRLLASSRQMERDGYKKSGEERRPQLFGQKFCSYKCSLAVYAYGLGQYRQTNLHDALTTCS